MPDIIEEEGTILKSETKTMAQMISEEIEPVERLATVNVKVVEESVFNDAQGLIYEGKEILRAMNVVVSDNGVDGWNCIMEDSSVVLIPKTFFESELGHTIIVGVV